jgi:predicted ferric reductase
MTLWQTITWDTARTAGFVAYGLLTLSVALGLALSLRWYSRSWPRWATNDLHRYVTLVTLVFIGIHSLALWLDPFMRFSVAEILVPMASHYRPIWMALGIVAAYFTLALWLSERVQRHIGYGWWRRLHYLTFGVYGLATVHGLGTGSDTRARWAQMIYAGSVVLVFSLLLAP